MQRLFLALIILTLPFSLFASQADADQGRLDPSLRAILAQAAKGQSLASYASKMAVFDNNGLIIVPPTISGRNADRLGVLVKVTNPFWGTSFLGIPVTMSTGTILGMRVSLLDLLTLVASPDVIYIEPDWKTEPKLDKSVPAIGADVVHAPPTSDTGENVIIGAVDTGIDYEHLDFRYDSDGDGFEESSRIMSIWDQTSGLFGAYYSNGQIESDIANGFGPSEGIVREGDTEGHGTHVMGIAAGDGSSSDAGMVGVAPGAEIIAVKTSFYTSDILSGVSYVFDQAEQAGLPAVVNLSLGGHEGPHDGTSLFEQGLDELLDRPGRAIVVSAGNEGDVPLHVSRTLAGNSATFSVDPKSDSLELCLWYPGQSSFTIVVTPPAGSPLTVTTGMAGNSTSVSGTVTVDNASSGVNPENNDNEALITLSQLTTAALWNITVTDAGGGGRFDGWITSNDGTIGGGDSSSTIDEPGNAKDVITVGAFNTKAQWPSLAGEQDFSSSSPVGSLSYFSSIGPTRDGRQKPELTAPGAWICSARSSSSATAAYLINPDLVHTMNLGTSMSAPHVTGVVALMLSLDSQLTPSEIKNILTETATQDSFTGTVPNESWGWGKVNASDAVAALNSSSEQGSTEEVTVTLAANPVASTATFVYSLPSGTTEARLHVIDISGRSVLDTLLSVGGTQYTWDLIDSSGRPLANGLYLFTIVTDKGNSSVGRLVISR